MVFVRGAWAALGGQGGLVLGCSPLANIVQGIRSFLRLFNGQEVQRRLSLQAPGRAGIAVCKRASIDGKGRAAEPSLRCSTGFSPVPPVLNQ